MLNILLWLSKIIQSHMGSRESLNVLLNFFLFTMNFFNFATGGQYINVRNKIFEITSGIPIVQDDIDFIKFTLNSQAAIYFVAATITTVSCIYALTTIPCGFRGRRARHVDFFFTLISACFQTALAVMSSINTVTYQQNIGNVILASPDLSNLQQLIMTVSVLNFCAVLPLNGVLLYQKWAIFVEGAIQEDRLMFKFKVEGN